MADRPVIIGIDGGGTFTDLLVLRPEGTLTSRKVPSTPDAPADAFLECVRLALEVGRAAPDESGEGEIPQRRAEVGGAVDVAVGTTLATNTVLEGKGARTALVTTRGFRHVLEIGRQKRPGLYDPTVVKPAPLVPDDLLFEVEERVDASGRVLVAPDPASLEGLEERLRWAGAESVAVCTLFSFLEPGNENAIAENLGGLPVSVSSRLLPRMREYERASTTVLDAYVKPMVRGFAGELGERAGGLCSGREMSLNLMRSNGGVAPAGDAVARPAELILSGPAGGVLGGAFLADILGAGDLLLLDMGGTSADISLVVDGRAQWTGGGAVGPHPLALPMVEVVTIGAGGGSIARDDGGILSVGPQSAGARPGPICYGSGGTEPTVTDANVCAGRIGEDTVFGESVRLCLDDCLRGMDVLADGLGMTRDGAAGAVLDVVNTRMAHAARGAMSSRGLDPADMTLVAFGGSGPLHACAMAEELDMDRVVVPMHPGVFSSLGILMAGVRYHFTSTLVKVLDIDTIPAVEEALGGLMAEAVGKLTDVGVEVGGGEVGFSAELRYRGQSFEIDLPLGTGEQVWDGSVRPLKDMVPPAVDTKWMADISERFHREHDRLFGHRLDGVPVEVVSLHLSCRGTRPGLGPLEPTVARAVRSVGGEGPPGDDIGSATRRCLTRKGWMDAAVHARPDLYPGWSSAGPLVIEEPLCTTFVDEGWSARMDGWGCVHLRRAGADDADGGTGGGAK